MSDESWIVSGTRQKIVQLLNDAFNRFLRNKGLREYVFSGNRSAFYFDPTYPVRKLSGLRRAVSLTGVRKEYNWHYAIEGACSLFPLPLYSISYHVVFSREGAPLLIPRLQHSLRRSLGKDWYNRRWRELLLTAMLSLANPDETKLGIPVGDNKVVRMNAFPLALMASKGYREPKKNGVTDEPKVDASS